MIKCEVCGKKLVRLRTHLKKAHQMSVRSYSKYFPNAPLVDPVFSERMRLANLNSNATNNLNPIQKGEKRALKEEKENE